MSELSLAARVKRAIAARPRTDEDVERVVDEIEGIIRDLETVQINLSRARLRRRE
jgi:hypothetical protein